MNGVGKSGCLRSRTYVAFGTHICASLHHVVVSRATRETDADLANFSVLILTEGKWSDCGLTFARRERAALERNKEHDA